MAILDYSKTLNTAGKQPPLKGIIESRKRLQRLKVCEIAMETQQQHQDAQQAEM